MYKKALILILSLCFFPTFSQSYRRTHTQRELGFFAGGSYYIGDLNNRTHFVYSKPAVGIFYRHSISYRAAFRFGLNYGQLAASDAQSSDANQQERNINYNTKLYEFSSVAEYNFVEYRIGHDKHRFSLYIFGGLSAFYFNPVTSGFSEEKSYPKTQLSVPFGAGFKWNVGKKCGLSVEWGPRRTFTDYLDDVSGTYPVSVGNGSGDGVNPNGVSGGAMRGDPTMKDWYFFYGLTFNIKLRDPHKTCHGSGKGRK